MENEMKSPSPDLGIGACYDVERSDYYAPNFILLYLHNQFQSHSEPVGFPPTAVKPYSFFDTSPPLEMGLVRRAHFFSSPEVVEVGSLAVAAGKS